MFKRNSPQKGFTLIELLVVISILSMLASLIFAVTKEARAKARDAARKIELRALGIAIESCYNEACNESYPGSVGAFDNLVQFGYTNTNFNILTPAYISKIPKDPTKGASGYLYFRKDWTGSGTCTAISSNKYAIYAHLENPDNTDISTLSDSFDMCVAAAFPAYGINYRVGN